jgi:1-acyl-sn-glycerol-3-phosphate acyltransferase
VNPIYLAGWVLYRLAFALYFRWRVFHAERVPRTGPAILACNHASHLDPPLVGASLPRPICYLARQSLFAVPLFGWVLRKVHAVPVDREGGGGAGLKAILNQLRLGQAILLFPEGTRTLDGNLQPARSGIGLAVIKSAAPVIPIRVFGTYQAFGKKTRCPRPHPVRICFGEPLDFEPLRAEARTCPKPRLKEIYQEVADRIMQAIAEIRLPEGK